jgi:hypothetical protein
MANKKPATTNPFSSLPAPCFNKPVAGDVFRKATQTLVVMQLDKGAPSAVCYEVGTGKTKTIKRSALESAYDRVSPNESAKLHKQLSKSAKQADNNAKATAKPEAKPRKPRAKKADAKSKNASNAPAAGPAPFLN